MNTIALMRYLEDMKYVLITGCAGFLGSNLAKHHLVVGDGVWGLDCFASSDPKSAHFARLQEYPRFVFKEHDITDPHFPEMPSHFDVVYNLACPASPPVYQSMPIFTMKTCVLGTANVLDIAGEMKCPLVHASTSEVYGNPKRNPQKESQWGNVNSYGPRACYDEGKRAAEALCYDYLHSRGVDARLCRIFNTYGPNMDPYDGRVVSNFIRQALKDEPLTIYGDGLQTRSFCYVSDLIRGIVAMGELEKNPGTPVNLGNPHDFTILELAIKALSKVQGLSEDMTLTEQSIKTLPLPVDDPVQRKPDVTLAKKLLGWEPTVMLDEGLERTIEYFRSIV